MFSNIYANKKAPEKGLSIGYDDPMTPLAREEGVSVRFKD